MKIGTNCFDEEDVTVDKITVRYMQEPDSDQEDKSKDQILTIESCWNGVGNFARLHIGETGWAINEPEDLVKIVNDFWKRVDIVSDDHKTFKKND
jgi:hypothetical protein